MGKKVKREAIGCRMCVCCGRKAPKEPYRTNEGWLCERGGTLCPYCARILGLDARQYADLGNGVRFGQARSQPPEGVNP